MISNFQQLYLSQKSYFHAGATRSYEFRMAMLAKLEELLLNNERAINGSLKIDFKKHPHEVWTSETGFVLREIKHAKKNLKNWMKPRKVSSPLAIFPSSSQIISEPKGVALIISPWNFPLQLTLAPLVASLAAGNCSIIKPSEISASTSQLIQEIINKNFDSSFIHVILGGKETTQALLRNTFDSIFFTGSPGVGKVVYEAAAKTLTPVTLELGGKSPVLVEPDADLDLAARRIIWGKIFNAGQTCVAPDYVYAHETIYDLFCDKLKKQVLAQAGARPFDNESFPRIINSAHFNRVKKLINKDKIYHGGDTRESDLYIEPTILKNVNWSDLIMQEEIFGPLIPVLKYNSINQILQEAKYKPKPLAAYLFSNSSAIQSKFINDFSSGSMCINDVIVQYMNTELPFGGIGESGIGSYHGHWGFEAFSHRKSVLKRSGILDISARYSPYTDSKINVFKKLFRLN